MIKLNIGCGSSTVKGWINIDKYFDFSPETSYARKLEKRTKVLQLDIKNGLPFKNQSIDYIYSKLFIQCLDFNDIKKFLDECFRVLKNNGIIRIFTPDLKATIASYINKNDQIINKVNKSEYIKVKGIETHADALNALFRKWKSENWWLDEDSLTNFLKKACFKEIKQKNAQESMISDMGKEKLEGKFKKGDNPNGVIIFEAVKYE